MNVSLTEAEGRLPDLVSAALAGDEVVIGIAGRAAVKLVPVEQARGRPTPDAWSDLPKPADDWDSPQTNRQIAAQWLGSDD
jgi:antitoxin (DNA-binding transcriptional repressor) of toxin-antitoxin stability system